MFVFLQFCVSDPSFCGSGVLSGELDRWAAEARSKSLPLNLCQDFKRFNVLLLLFSCCRDKIRFCILK